MRTSHSSGESWGGRISFARCGEPATKRLGNEPRQGGAMRRLNSLGARLLLTIGLVVVLSVGLTVAVGIQLTKREVERATIRDLNRKAFLIAAPLARDINPQASIAKSNATLKRQ